MSWIGKAATEPRVIVVAQQSPIRTYQDLAEQKQAVNFAAAGIGSASYVETVMLTNVLNLPIRLLTGYNGNEDQLAMRRSEIVGTLSARSTWDPFVNNGFGRYIAQIGGTHKDVPQLASLVTDPDAKTLIALIQSQGDVSRLTAGPPGIPDDRLQALRDAYRKAMEDKELLAKMEKLGLPVDPAYGDDVLKAIKAALNQKPETVKLLDEALKSK
jgi:tripartite-type tricarboxylate transporter receptor subunit TctC